MELFILFLLFWPIMAFVWGMFSTKPTEQQQQTRQQIKQYRLLQSVITVDTKQKQLPKELEQLTEQMPPEIVQLLQKGLL